MQNASERAVLQKLQRGREDVRESTQQSAEASYNDLRPATKKT